MNQAGVRVMKHLFILGHKVFNLFFYFNCSVFLTEIPLNPQIFPFVCDSFSSVPSIAIQIVHTLCFDKIGYTVYAIEIKGSFISISVYFGSS